MLIIVLQREVVTAINRLWDFLTGLLMVSQLGAYWEERMDLQTAIY
jgi:hypothetical protein